MTSRIWLITVPKSGTMFAGWVLDHLGVSKTVRHAFPDSILPKNSRVVVTRRYHADHFVSFAEYCERHPDRKGKCVEHWEECWGRMRQVLQDNECFIYPIPPNAQDTMDLAEFCGVDIPFEVAERINANTATAYGKHRVKLAVPWESDNDGASARAERTPTAIRV